ncbi:MAG: Holliday junction resolvase RuvX [Pseudanabaena sp.]|uniref:Holliday junction resolvase RuvX n=1 Tax=Pseudanabaena mucicola TaxID=71190 RepID=UPI0025774249|nr:Holliday junction resolvase RuvX [Pseudanabaena mucicola]MCA6575326.1 Holliday junction resolvase RuvX [Pseudanabaena sp. M53BS1SP1A06MG]MCA6585002.1 Holliday junction resolvase RuvX [Pseudanabaena sp. M051S1SP1A06QC]MCA6588393.1 Holliday junction resolvase RuvX [Pseudanabaena sp. M109S1SP1A06QC]MCA6594623.1 Holliday junction resolvase RuvX [Pseudanabaena sp. M38BS1SP1A06MG]MCA6595906.1 Holliday junction resolvase RuvX [Pseudanabaena sp. M046S1SP1A06QC]MCA6599226.1 Holliday junction resolv
MLLGFDPGKQKCGIAVMGLDRKLHFQTVIPSVEAITKVGSLLNSYPISLMVMGDQTASQQWKAKLQSSFPDLRIITVDERYSSEQARQRFWEIYPATGLMKLVPRGMRSPDRPIDDIVAAILIERYLSRLISS